MKLGRGLTYGSLGGVWWRGPSGALLVGGTQLTSAAWLGSVNSRHGFRILRPPGARDAGRLSFLGAGRDRMRLFRISLGCRARRQEQQRQDQPSHARQTIGADRQLRGEDAPYVSALASAPLQRGMHHWRRRENRVTLLVQLRLPATLARAFPCGCLFTFPRPYQENRLTPSGLFPSSRRHVARRVKRPTVIVSEFLRKK